MSVAIESVGKVNFKHEEKIQIRFNDIDVLGHVNNAVQLNYYDYGKMKYFETMKHGLINWHEAELVIVNLNINFFVPIFMGDDIRVRTKIYEIGRKSVKLIQVLYDEKTKQIKSMCEAVMCGFDVRTNTSTLISEEWRRLITGFEGDVIQKQSENK